MRSLASYILAALALGLALDLVAPAIGSPERWPSVETTPAQAQNVNRDGKADRLNVTGRNSLDKTVREVPAPAAQPRRNVPEGCDPAFSPLSASARLNYASRCLADNSNGLIKAS